MRVTEVNQALLLPRLSSGVSNKALGLCWGPGAMMTLLVASSAPLYYAAIPIGLSAIAHAALTWAYKKDFRVFAIYGQYANLAKRYHPETREKLPQPFERPYKVARGVRM
jgi:hypothetical protein